MCVCVRVRAFANMHTYSFLCYQSKFQKQKIVRIDGLFGRNYFDRVVCNIQLRALLPFSFRKGAWFFFFPLLCLFATLFHYFYFKDLNLTLILKLSILLYHKASSSAENESFQELLCITEI